MKAKYIVYMAAGCILFSCGNSKEKADAYGTFEAEETIISAEVAGTIKALNLEEGDTLSAGEVVGFIDSTQLFLRKQQLVAQVGAVLSRRPDINSQIAVLEEQLRIAEREQKRIHNLVLAEAATGKQLDDINAQIALIKKQIVAQRTLLNTTSTGLNQETNPIALQIAQINDQLMKSRLINPLTGTVLTKYARAYELAAPGKPLYKIADMSTLILRAYITGDAFSKIKSGQKVKIKADNGKKDYREYEGRIIWISDKAEFTPKTIQTKEERANLVYAIKILVKNDGFLKMGMYGEVNF